MVGPNWVQTPLEPAPIPHSRAVSRCLISCRRHIIRGFPPGSHPIASAINWGRDPLHCNGSRPFFMSKRDQAISGRIRGGGSKVGPNDTWSRQPSLAARFIDWIGPEWFMAIVAGLVGLGAGVAIGLWA